MCKIREIVRIGDIVIGDSRGREPLVHAPIPLASGNEEAVSGYRIAREKLGLEPVSGAVGSFPRARNEPGLPVHDLAQNDRRILYRIRNPYAKQNDRAESRCAGGDPHARAVVKWLARE